MPKRTHRSIKNKIPKNLQPALWSVNVNDLDYDKDKAYIINQILAYGGIKELKWLFKKYSNKEIKNIFINKPMKIYTPSGFNFIKEILLNLQNKKFLLDKYDKNLPRFIRR